MQRTYFDNNEGTETGTYGLWLDGSRQDLAKTSGGPHEGVKVAICKVGEIEIEAILEWNPRLNAWTALPIERTVRPDHEVCDLREGRTRLRDTGVVFNRTPVICCPA